MKTIANKTLALTAFVALFGAAGLAVMESQPASAQPEIVKLEPVLVVGKRATNTEAPVAIVQLPRVEVVGHRASSGAVSATAMAKNCTATAVC
ncbi:hypothetical protein ACFJGW_04690 [Burkholderiaceae bacterium UC74_6]